MICPKCSAEVEDTALICPVCGEQIAVKQQEEKCAKANTKLVTNIGEMCHSPLFLVYAIIISVISLVYLIGMVDTKVYWLIRLFKLPLFICVIVSTVGAWMAYAGKKENSKNQIGKIKAFMTCNFVYAILRFILYVTVCVIIMGLAALILSAVSVGTEYLEEITERIEESGYSVEGLDIFLKLFQSGGVVLFIIAGIICAVIITYGVFDMKVYKCSKNYWIKLKETANKGVYDVPKAPGVLLFIWGGATVLGAVLGFSMLKNAVGFISVIESLACGGLLIVQGIIFKKIHPAQQCVRKEIESENEALARIQKETQAEIDKAKQEEEKKNATTTAENQQMMQQMMQMLMSQMQQNNSSSTPADPKDPEDKE